MLISSASLRSVSLFSSDCLFDVFDEPVFSDCFIREYLVSIYNTNIVTL